MHIRCHLAALGLAVLAGAAGAAEPPAPMSAEQRWASRLEMQKLMVQINGNLCAQKHPAKADGYGAGVKQWFARHDSEFKEALTARLRSGVIVSEQQMADLAAADAPALAAWLAGLGLSDKDAFSERYCDTFIGNLGSLPAIARPDAAAVAD
jgi:hypothetical protein